jgi:hypothetical protein
MNLPLDTDLVPVEIFQNVGIWGLDGTPMVISCESLISELEIFIDSESKQFLNIRALEFILDSGETIVLAELLLAAKLSSNYYFDVDGSDDVSSRLLNRMLIHSNYEVRPSLKLKFKSPLNIKRINVFNRDGIWGLRSQFIAINGFLNGDRIFIFRNVSDKLKNELHDELNAVIASYDKPIHLPKDAFSAASYIRKIVSERMLAGENINETLITALLPINAPMPRLDTLSAIYLSKVIDDQLQGKSQISTSKLRNFSSILCDDVSIDSLGHFASKYLSEIKPNPVKVVIAKHRIHFDTLVSQRDAHLDFLDGLLLSLSTLDAQPAIAYGTLLGAYRNGSFLPADDDIDMILYFPNVVTEEEKALTINALLEHLRGLNYSANIQKGCPHITVNSKTAAVCVDIFPAWDSLVLNNVSVVMEKLLFRDVSVNTLFPTSKIELYGRSYPCPADVKAFLADRYGPGWYRSDPYHEWSWSIARRAYFHEDIVSNLHALREKQRHLRSSRTRTQLIAWSQCVLQKKRPPSNSIPMLLQAIEYGYDVIELDIRSSKDGEIILAHDDLIRNDNSEQICISKSTLDEVLNFRSGKYDGEDIFMASLDQALPYLQDKKVLLDARFEAADYAKLRSCIDRTGFDRSRLLFCVYNVNQISPLMQYFSESLHFWKFYTQAWEIDTLVLSQIRQYGIDGIMYMYPHFDEDISEQLYEIKKRDLQSMCFIHGENWTPPHSSGLNPSREKRSADNYNLSLKRMVSMGIEYVTSIKCELESFRELID